MRVRLAATALGTTAALLTVPACSTGTTTPRPAQASSPHTGTPSETGHKGALLRPAELDQRLLDESDLDAAYTRTPEPPSRNDDITVLGCPALARLGDDAVTGGSLDFPRRAKTAFTYAGTSGSELSEELYSDTADTLSKDTGRIFDAMACPKYRLRTGTSDITVTTRQTSAPRLGAEQWSHLLTFSAHGADTVMKQTAIRDGSTLLVVSGSPALVDQHLHRAYTKATSSR
ncbi:hypothetical protein ABZ820_05120 [Streptomyces diacarni]|uniref:hypothetical protein n=1 Tax=Streptomyces diacarni TaxID=2800381 RepID=UPI0033E53209